MRAAMKHAGVSVTVTSVTDMVAFAIGTSTALPALSSFCVYAACGILLLYGAHTAHTAYYYNSPAARTWLSRSFRFDSIGGLLTTSGWWAVQCSCRPSSRPPLAWTPGASGPAVASAAAAASPRSSCRRLRTRASSSPSPARPPPTRPRRSRRCRMRAGRCGSISRRSTRRC